MKVKLFAIATALLLSVVATSTCYAQQTVLTVKIPFAFQDGNRTLPAGEYRVERLLSGTELVQQLRQIDGDAVMNVQTISIESKTGNQNPELVFNRYGQTYFLSQIWTGEAHGRQLFKSNYEKSIEREQVRSEIALLLQPTSVSR
jgi:hypothetical protein